jgi:hypothetical protein
LKGDFTGINPRLGQELERVFEHAGPDTLRRSAHQPFLRLGEDLGSLEIVGPRQDMSLSAASGLTWVVDGQRFPTPRTEEFLLQVTDRPRVLLELSGLVRGALPPRTFVLRLKDLAEPFILFDERTRRQRRAGGPIPSGRYWLLHRAADSIDRAEQRYDWPDGERALSLFQVRPGAEAKLESEAGGPWRFAAALTAFLDAVGERLAHEAGEPVCFGWLDLPFVWLPVEEMDVHMWAVSRTGDEAGGMAKCRIESSNFLTKLRPAMYHFKLILNRSERGRIEAQAEYLFWKGLEVHDSSGFRLEGLPKNLLRPKCRGFEFGETVVRHLIDQHRRHTLAFDVGGTQLDFHWSQPGIFLESLERHIGKHAELRSHNLGEAFSASLNSARWLKIWLVGQSGWEVIVADQLWLRDIGRDRRDFVELGLASLAMAFPQGGEIRLRFGEGSRLVARFSSPLQPVALDRVDEKSYTGFRFYFSEPVVWMRLVLIELASGQRHALGGQQFSTSGQCVFAAADLPQVECCNFVDETAPGGSLDYPVTLHVPKQGWPKGLWFIELEVRRDEHSDWEAVALRGRDFAPVVVSTRDSQAAATIRERLFWASFALGTQLPDFSLDEAEREELFELIMCLIALRQRNIASPARQGMSWLKDAVRSLSRITGRIARQPDGSRLQTKLLSLACQDSRHAGFVHLPGLLALPAGEYRELPTGDPLNDALRRCGRLAMADSVAEAVRDDLAFLDLDVIGCFANFSQVAAAPNGEPSAAEFNRFAHERYWQSVLGTLQHDQLTADWSGEGALGRAHIVWALAELVRRYDQPTHEMNLAAANALLHCAPGFRAWLHHRLASKALMASTDWNAPWPRFAAPEVDFLEVAPRFASLFALAARAASAGFLEFDESLSWLEHHVERRWMAEEGIAVLVGLAPELFGHLLLFWELIVRTAHH